MMNTTNHPGQQDQWAAMMAEIQPEPEPAPARIPGTGAQRVLSAEEMADLTAKLAMGVPAPTAPAEPYPGQSDADAEAWMSAQKRAQKVARGLYARALYQHLGEDGRQSDGKPARQSAAYKAWNAALTDYQRQLLRGIREKKDDLKRDQQREARRQKAAAEGRVLRQYRQGLTDEEKKIEAKERLRAHRQHIHDEIAAGRNPFDHNNEKQKGRWLLVYVLQNKGTVAVNDLGLIGMFSEQLEVSESDASEAIKRAYSDLRTTGVLQKGGDVISIRAKE